MTLRPLSSAIAGLSLACAFASTAVAAQPPAPESAPAVAPAPAPESTPAVAPAPAPAPSASPVVVPSSGHTTVIVNTPPAATPAPAPAPQPWVIAPIEPRPAAAACPCPAPAPAPAPVVVPQVHVVTPQPMKPPSKEELARLRLVSETSRAHGLAVAGWATLGTGYFLSALVGTVTMDTAGGDRRRRLYGGWMTVPLGGPFISAFYARSHTGGLFTAALGVTQVAGLAIGIVGSARHRRLKRQLSLAAGPLADGGGVTVSGRF